MLRLLLIDDSEQDRALVIYKLKSEFAEIQIKEVVTSDQCQQELAAGNFEFVITDYNLRWSDGITVLHEIKSRYPNCPVIMFTGSGSQEIAVEAMKAGLDDYIIKSVKHYVRLPVVIRSILHRKQQQQITQNILNEQAQLLDLVDEAIFVRNADNAITYWNCSAEQLYGWTTKEALSKIAHILLQTQFPLDCPNIDEILHQQTNWSGEVIQTRRDGSQIIVESRQVLMRDAQGKPKGVLEVNRNITERKKAEQQLRQSAFYDALTGLANRALFMERLKHALTQTKRQENYLFAVLFLDLDRFKVINDSLGHIKGDQFLVMVANRLSKCLRSTDTAARLGGDEFTILLDGIYDVSDAIKVAGRIQQELTLPLDLGTQEFSTSASIGIALSTTVEYERPEDILRDADTAMYRAKALGKARFELFNQQMYASALARLQLENDLRRAIECEEFRVYYQPIVALTSDSILGFEALLRWQHPERGLLPPADFIPLAEETGLIVEMGYWVLQQACHQMQQWLTAHYSTSLERISVNLSLKQFSQPDLIERIAQILVTTGLNPHNLILEITESAIMENSQAIATLSQLQHLGIQLSIDDFGTGYSSLERLYNFPISNLKIDRSFINRKDGNYKNLEIVEIIVSLARKLGVNVTAEGVETTEQLAFLKKLNCENAQGYLFSQPVNNLAATQLLKDRGTESLLGRNEDCL